jgi:hypothetical protein
MKLLRDKLADYLMVEGWEVREIPDADLEWWADEIWELTSRWSPEGMRAFLIFLVDPQWDGNRKKRQGVWAVGRSRIIPVSRVGAEHDGVLTLRAAKEEIESFVDGLNRYRWPELRNEDV